MGYNFTTLQTLIQQTLDHSDSAVTNQIGGWINEAIYELETGIVYPDNGIENVVTGWKCMEKYARTTSSDAYLSFPTVDSSTFKEPIWMKVKSDGILYPLDQLTLGEALDQYPELDSNTGRPRKFAINYATGEILVRPTPDTSYDFHLYYYARSAVLTSTNSNWWTSTGWPVLMYRVLMKAEPFLIKDDRIQTWTNMFLTNVKQLHKAEKAMDFSGPIAVQCWMPKQLR